MNNTTTATLELTLPTINKRLKRVLKKIDKTIDKPHETTDKPVIKPKYDVQAEIDLVREKRELLLKSLTEADLKKAAISQKLTGYGILVDKEKVLGGRDQAIPRSFTQIVVNIDKELKTTGGRKVIDVTPNEADNGGTNGTDE